MNGITVVVPSIPPRAQLLARALTSITSQSLAPDAIVVEIDHAGDGAPVTRDRGLRKVTTEWVAFLDDDDEMLPEHLEVLAAAAARHGADYVFSYYEIFDGQRRGGYDPVLGHFGKAFDPDRPHQTTITILVRTELAQQVGFRFDIGEHGLELIDGQRIGEDWLFTLGCIGRDARIVHVPQRTWLWHHDSGNTSGRPWNRQEAWA